MDRSKCLEALFGYAAQSRFESFDEEYAALASAAPGEVPALASLMRAQVGLYICDDALLGDLEWAGEPGAGPRIPCLDAYWKPDSPNRFSVLRTLPHTTSRFLEMLPRAAQLLDRWYGAAGRGMVCQIQSEMLYFMGRFDESIALADEQCLRCRDLPGEMLLAKYVQFRCLLATGAARAAERHMLDMVNLAKRHPECTGPYGAIRCWANLTTGWGGDSRRFNGAHELPVLEDRLQAIRMGISQLSDLEEGFARYARRRFADCYTMREHYMDIFHAVYWFREEDFGQAMAFFCKAYPISLDTGIVMPFAEYGLQIIPLLEYAGETDRSIAREWIAAVVSLAENYEVGLERYRA